MSEEVDNMNPAAGSDAAAAFVVGTEAVDALLLAHGGC